MTSRCHWLPSIFVSRQFLITAKVLVTTLIRLTVKAGVGNQDGNKENKGNGDGNAGNKGGNERNTRK